MSYKIAVASGKGGTGKTTLAVNLYRYVAQNVTESVMLVDCDVEEPNDIIFIPEASQISCKKVYQLLPEIDKSKCTYCRECVEYCEFNAIVIIPPVQFAEVNPDLCHSCGACKVACPAGAITEKNESVGDIIFYRNGVGMGIEEGVLKVGSVMQTMLVRELKKDVSEKADIIIYDAPPGTSCPVVATIADCDYLVLVTEPTPFGLHDLKLMVELVRELKKPFGVIVNKSGIGDDQVYRFLKEENIVLLGEIPFSKDYASQYASGNLLRNIPEQVKLRFSNIFKEIEKFIFQHEGDNYFKW